MKKTLNILLILVFSKSFIFGQNSYLRLIEKKKYSKAEKKITKALSKTPDDIALNYSYAVLLISEKYKYFNPPKSYEYIIKSKTLYERIVDEKEIKSLNKIPITLKLFQDYIDTICGYAIKKATSENSVESYNNFLDYYKTSPYHYKKTAIENRDIVAYTIASNENTIESFQYFITTYPHAVQYNDAIKKRNSIAFSKAQAIGEIESYKTFISMYPSSEEVPEAWKKIYELAYNDAEKENSSSSYKKFIAEYPKASQYSKAFKKFETRQFYENIVTGDWESFRNFIQNYANNSWKSVAVDSIYAISSRTQNTEALKYCLENLIGQNRNNALLLYHDLYTADGEKKTLDMFYNTYDDPIFDEIKIKDYEIANLGNELSLHFPYSSSSFSKYDNYIRLAAPREKAFVALQRVISIDIATKNWESAIKKIKSYGGVFGTKNKKIINLIS
ncbi:MAG: hypothetical protein NTX97_11695, partial [Bacteroidetes bacterium]|nr:hypothetical protein [Bacteroidota bacterium]